MAISGKETSFPTSADLELLSRDICIKAICRELANFTSLMKLMLSEAYRGPSKHLR